MWGMLAGHDEKIRNFPVARHQTVQAIQAGNEIASQDVQQLQILWLFKSTYRAITWLSKATGKPPAKLRNRNLRL